MKQQVLVISKDLAISAKIQMRMQDSLTDICCVTSLVTALASYMKQDYCLVILDIEHPDTEGIELLRTMSQVKHTPIMMLVESPNMEDTVKFLHAGADVCIGKPINLDVCEAQANALIQLYIGSDIHKPHTPIIHGKELMIIPCCRQVIVDGKPLELARKEFDLLYYFAKSPGQIFTREQLYDQIWGDGPAIAVDEAVRTQIKRLRRKLASVGKNYIQTEWGVGYKFVLSDYGA